VPDLSADNSVTTRRLVILAAVLEAATGGALIAAPVVVAHMLLGADLSSGGVAVARVGGMALLSLGIACWPVKGAVAAPAFWALLAYNGLVGCYVGYLGLAGGFRGTLLWPACAVHGVLLLCLAQRAWIVRTVRGTTRSRPARITN
jgi:hypothetical protein